MSGINIVFGQLETSELKELLKKQCVRGRGRERLELKHPHEHYMRLALREAARGARAGEVPIGALLVAADGEVVSRAYNRPVGGCDPTAHAEIVALRRAARRFGNYRLPGTTLYATLEPCAMCAGALVLARVSRVVFGATDPKGGAARTLYRILDDPRLNHQTEVVGGVLETECRGILQQFFRDRRAQSSKGTLPT